jgi:hypothetical protein
MLRVNDDFTDNDLQDCHVFGERQWIKSVAGWTFLTEAVGPHAPGATPTLCRCKKPAYQTTGALDGRPTGRVSRGSMSRNNASLAGRRMAVSIEYSGKRQIIHII